MTVQESAFGLTAADGHRIRGISWRGDAPPVAHIQIAHGRGEHARRYERAARELVRAGFWVHANDHRGHGEAAREAGRLGDFGPRGFAAVVSDMAEVGGHIRRAHPAAPLILFGHSMGSFAAQYFLLDHSPLIDGLMLCGTAAVDLRDPRHPGHVDTDWNAGIDAPRTPFDWLTRDGARTGTVLMLRGRRRDSRSRYRHCARPSP